MADIFVNKSGSDSFDGSSRVFITGTIGPKLTLGGAFAIAALGDIIRIGAGVYNENVLLNGGPTGTAGVTFEADFDDAYGPVVMDGDGIIAEAFTKTGVGSAIKLRGLIIRNYTGDAIKNLGSSLGLQLNDVVIHNCGAAMTHRTGGSSALSLTDGSRRVLIFDCPEGWVETGVGTPGFMREFTFVGCSIEAIDHRPFGGGDRNLRVFNCLFKDNPIHMRIDVANYGPADRNCIFFSGGDKTVVQGVDQLTLVAHQAAVLTDDVQSVSVDPIFVDEAKRFLRLDQASPVATVFTRGPTRHAGFSGKPTTGQTINRNAADWTGAVAVDTVLVGDDYELDAAVVGTVAPDVINFGKPRRIRRLVPKGFENYPLEVFDKDKTDESPNRPQIEYRGSNTAFLKGDGAPAFVEAVIGEDIKLSFQYFQVRVTLRSDGVEA